MLAEGSPADRLILFDIDGTLLRSQGAGREATRLAMVEVFGTAGKISDHHFGGKTDWQTLIELLEEHGFDETRIGEAMLPYEEALGRHLAAVIDLFPVHPCDGALELVQRLHRRTDVMLGIVTGNVSTAVAVKLRAAGFDPDWFVASAHGSEAVSRDDLPPLAISRASAHRGRPFAPEHVIVVGDTPADVASARACGAVAVAVATGFAELGTLEAAQPDYLLADLTSFDWVVLGRG